MRYIFIAAVLVIVLVGGFSFLKNTTYTPGGQETTQRIVSINNGAEKKMSPGKIVVKNDFINVGELPMDEGKVEIIYEIENTGDTSVTLQGADGSCFCTQGFVSDEDGGNISQEINSIGSVGFVNLNRVMQPGEKSIVTAIYDPLAHGPDEVGPTVRGLTIQTDSPATPVIKLNFGGTVVKTRTNQLGS